MKFSEVDECVQRLNEDFLDRSNDDSGFLPFMCESTGLGIGILFCGYRVWHTDGDCRIWHDESDTQESLYACVVRESLKIQRLVSKALPDSLEQEDCE